MIDTKNSANISLIEHTNEYFGSMLSMNALFNRDDHIRLRIQKSTEISDEKNCGWN